MNHIIGKTLHTINRERSVAFSWSGPYITSSAPQMLDLHSTWSGINKWTDKLFPPPTPILKMSTEQHLHESQRNVTASLTAEKYVRIIRHSKQLLLEKKSYAFNILCWYAESDGMLYFACQVIMLLWYQQCHCVFWFFNIFFTHTLHILLEEVTDRVENKATVRLVFCTVLKKLFSIDFEGAHSQRRLKVMRSGAPSLI